MLLSSIFLSFVLVVRLIPYGQPILGEERADDLAAELGELFEASGVEEGEAIIVKAEQAENGDVKIADGMNLGDGGGADFICGANGVAGVDAAAGEPKGHGFGVVVAPISDAAADAVVRGSSKFSAPNDKRFVQKAAVAQVADESGNGLVDLGDEGAMSAFDKVVRVPSSVKALHEAHALFHQAPGQQTFSPKVAGCLFVDAVHLQGARIFLGDV